MKKLFSLILVVVLALFLASCESSTDPKEEPINEFDVLVNYLEAGDANYEGWVNTMASWIFANVGDSTATYAGYYLLDFRSEADYNTMHIPGAVNTTLATMFDDADNSGGLPILCVCYSGQTASFAHMLLRMKGYEAYVLKFGMSSYHPTLDKWTGKCTNDYANDAKWVTTASPALPANEYPTLSTGMTTAEEILDARIDVAIAAWPTLTSASDAVTNNTTYNIINYWAETDYLGYGHIEGSYQVTPSTLTQAENLSVFDPANTNIIYCWTGQTAAATCAYLTVLGYDVKSIAYGANNMIWDELTAHKWPKPW